MRQELLLIYLNDHLAAAVAAIELAERCRRQNEGSQLAEWLVTVGTELHTQRRLLEELITRFDGRVDVVKRTAAWLGEKVGRLKRNGEWVRYSDLSRVVELEGLRTLLSLQADAWRGLHAVLGEARDFANVPLAQRLTHTEWLLREAADHHTIALRRTLAPTDV